MVASIVPLRNASVGNYYVNAVGGPDRMTERTADELNAAVGYYNGHGEEPGRWHGKGAEDLGLAGAVDPEVFRALLQGRHPETGEPLRSDAGAFYLANPNLRPGWDMTFSPPNSVSSVWAMGDSGATASVERAHKRAVARALSYVQTEAARVRRGRGGTLQYAADGLIAAGFQHRTSRAGDPQLHEHVILLALAKGPDGRYTTLESKELYDHFKTAGSVYHAALREELTAELGVRWTARDANGLSEIVGVNEDLMKTWSKRRQMIEAEVLERGGDVHNAAHCEAATLATREGKEGGKTTGELRADWEEEAASLGITREQFMNAVSKPKLTRDEVRLARLGGQVSAIMGARSWSCKTVHTILEVLEVEPTERDGLAAALMEGAWCPPADRDRFALDRVTLNRSTFSRRLLIQALARLDGPADQLEARADALLRTPDAVLLRSAKEQAVGLAGDLHGVHATGRTFRAREQGTYTTPQVLDAEAAILQLARDGKGASLGVVDAEIVDAVLAARPAIAADQRSAVLHIATSGHRVVVVRGVAGAGKTFSLDAARQMLEQAGQTVIGCAPSGRAALELQDGSGIASSTIDSLVLSLEKGTATLAAGVVVVVDEAGMCGTRKLARLAAFIQQTDGARMVLVGDDKQLLSVAAGGMFREIVEQHPSLVAEMATNRRQRQVWERAALARLRTATPEHAESIVKEFIVHGRVHAAADVDAVLTEMARDYWDARQTPIVEHRDGEDRTRPSTAVLLAGRTADVDELNRLAITEAVRRGHLTGEALPFAGHDWLHGQAVIAGLNAARKHGVLNGQTGVVTGIEERPVKWRVTVEVSEKMRRRSTARITLEQGEPRVGQVHEYTKGGHGVVTAARPVRNAAGAIVGWDTTIESRTLTYETEYLPEVGKEVNFDYKAKAQKARGRLGIQRTGVVVAIAETKFAPHLAVKLDGSEGSVYLAEKYAAQHLSDGYAMTVHKAQGRTVDASLVYAAGLDRNGLYVALSRGRGLGDGDGLVAAVKRLDELSAQASAERTRDGQESAAMTAAVDAAVADVAARKAQLAKLDQGVVNNRAYVVGAPAVMAQVVGHEQTVAERTAQLSELRQQANALAHATETAPAERLEALASQAAAAAEAVAQAEADMRRDGLLAPDPADAGAFLRRGRVVAAEDRDTLVATMAGDYWDLTTAQSPELVAAMERVAAAQQAVDDLLFNPSSDLTEDAAARREADEAAAHLSEVRAGEGVEQQAKVIMIAKTRVDVAALNLAAIREGIRRGELSGSRTAIVGDQVLYVGQQAVITGADKRRGLTAGDRVQVGECVESIMTWDVTVHMPDGKVRTASTAKTVEPGTTFTVRGKDGVVTDVVPGKAETRLRLVLADGSTVDVSEKYVARSLVSGYALTAARAALVRDTDTRLLHTAGLEPEAKTALSAEDGPLADTRLYTVGAGRAVTQSAAERAQQQLVDDLAKQAGAATADLSATGELRARGALPQLAELSEERRYLAQALAQAPEGASRPRVETAHQLSKAVQRRGEVADRVAAQSRAGVVDAPTSAALEACDQEVASLRARLDELQSTPDHLCAQDQARVDFLAKHGGHIARFQQLTSVLDRAATLTVNALEVETPAYLPTRPESVLEQPGWREVALAVESYRTRWDVRSDQDPLGPRPANLLQRREWGAAASALRLDIPADPARSQDRTWDVR